MIYKVTNYGNTRTVYVKGVSWEISKGSTIEIDDTKVENAAEVADTFGQLQYVDIEIVESSTEKKTVKVKRKRRKLITK